MLTSAAYFNDWFHDVAGTNINIPTTIELSNDNNADKNVFSYINGDYFPIDGLSTRSFLFLDSKDKVTETTKMDTTTGLPWKSTPNSPTEEEKSSLSLEMMMSGTKLIFFFFVMSTKGLYQQPISS